MNEIHRRCPRCEAELPVNALDELCPKCLLMAGLETKTDPGPGAEGKIRKPAGMPQPGELFGHYRLVNTLGQGGMGAVFEAEDLESGRRVALKVLNHTLDTPDARERFFREGRLAASINHPNSVYIFGTEEIAGIPVISMELVPGGTLQDRVKQGGPLPVSEAVDCTLQIAAGLEAAQRIGILHRDVKPSNCFCDADGTVKIGDFGLSISTTVRTEPALTAAGLFLGTPAFCSPEQLRGDELDVRSDIYAVGATLFYLLTGRIPFPGNNPVQQLATVLEGSATPPRTLRKDIPAGLSSIVVRCLDKHPSARFRNYAELSDALAPYSSVAATPATLGLRFVAGIVDSFLLSLILVFVSAIVSGGIIGWMDNSREYANWMWGGLLANVAYFTMLEGLWGSTLGKRLFRLRVVGPDNGLPGLPRALGRALMCCGLPFLPFWIFFQVMCHGDLNAFVRAPLWLTCDVQVSFYLVVLLLFSSARRRNGCAAFHDRITQTRVIGNLTLERRPASPIPDESFPPASKDLRLIGPYHVLAELGESAGAQWLLGYDLRLFRKTWLRLAAPGTPPIPVSLRNIGRIGRLRWLAGKRSSEENWDAFEAASGQPFVEIVKTAQPWSQVRFWLHDLALEIDAAENDGTLPPVLALDRLWITKDGRIKLLDFPAPGLAATVPECPAQSPELFLQGVAKAALTGENHRMPVHALDFLESMTALSSARAVSVALQPLLNRLAEVSRLRRVAIVAASVFFPAVLSISYPLINSTIRQWNERSGGLMDLYSVLVIRDNGTSRGAETPPHPSDRQFGIYIARRFAPAIKDQAQWSSPFANSMIKGEHRRFAEQSLTLDPAPTEQEIAEAEKAVGGKLPSSADRIDTKRWFLGVVFGVQLLMGVTIPALIAALLFRGGLVLLGSGVTFVRADGKKASRLRVFWRSLIAWGSIAAVPFFSLAAVGFLAGLLKAPLGETTALILAAVLLAGLVIVSVALPERGLQDRLAGTWPVPR